MSASPDWNLIETAYRAGARSLRGIASEQGITEGAIRARARKAGWVRGIAQAVTHPSPEPSHPGETFPQAEGKVPASAQDAARLAALEAQVVDLTAQLEEAGELLRGLVRANVDAYRNRGPLYPWLSTRRPTRWG